MGRPPASFETRTSCAPQDEADQVINSQSVGEPGRPCLPWKQETGGSNPPTLTNIKVWRSRESSPSISAFTRVFDALCSGDRWFESTHLGLSTVSRASEATSETRPGTQRKKREAQYHESHVALGPGSSLARSLGRDTNTINL